MTIQETQKRIRLIIVMMLALAGLAFWTASPAAAQGGTGSITIVSSTNPAGTTGVFFFTSLGSFTLDDGQSHVYSNLAAGSYDLFQSVDAGWEVSASCDGTTSAPLNNGVQVTLAEGENVTCTFNYSEVGGSITVVAASDPAGATGFSYFGDLGVFSLDDGQSYQVTDKLPGDYAIFQGIPQAWTLNISCVGGDSTVNADNVTVHLDANEDIVCTFSNSDIGATITVVAASNPAGATGFDYFASMGSFLLDDGQSQQFSSLLPGTYDIFQTIPAGWTLDIDCGAATATPAGGNGVSVTVGNNEDVVCTFTNNDLGGSITVLTTATPAGSTGFFYFGDAGSYTQDDGQSHVSSDLLPGDYQIYQSVGAGWLLDISCVGGDSTVGAGNVTVHLDAGEDIVCTFDNTDVGGSITFNNVADPADDGTEFTYFGDVGFHVFTAGQSHEAVDLYPGDYQIVQSVPQGWLLDVSCTGGDVTIVDNDVTVHLDANEDVVCDFNNTYVGGSITFNTVATPDDGTEFTYFGDLGFHVFTNGQSHEATDLYPGDYEIIQDIPQDWALAVNCTGGAATVAGGTVMVHLGANEAVVCTFANELSTGVAVGTLFFDDFESDQGWTVNPAGGDSATTGLWEVGNPEATYYYGYLQKGLTVSGVQALVTGAAAGNAPGSYDVDGGVTSVRSPNIDLPNDGTIMLSFYYYMNHLDNSGNDDYLRVQVVGDTTVTVYEEQGASNNDYSGWRQFEMDISNFAGQTVYLLIEAADNGSPSLVEAAIDDVSVEVIDVLFADDFESDQGWTTDANGNDTATTGLWERANPEGTYYYGRLQRNRTLSGDNNLVTGAAAGNAPGSYDVDGGLTSIRSVDIDLPNVTEGDITLSFGYYFTHLNNASSDDYFRVSVVGDTSIVVLEEHGAAYDNYSVWRSFAATVTELAGQTVYILIETADNGAPSLIEAAVDDVQLFIAE